VNTNDNKQSGFSAVIGIISVVVVIALIGLIGWRLYNNQPSKQTNNATSGNQSTGQTPATSNNTTSPAQQVDPNAGYVVIKEWGVRFKPVSGLTGVEYVNLDSNTVDFTTQQLASLDPNCNGQVTGLTVLGRVFRSTNSSTPSTLSLGKVGDYYYYYYSPEATCSSKSDVDSTETTMLGYLKESLPSLEAAK